MTAICGKPMLEIRFLPGHLKWTLLPKEHYGDSLRGLGLNPTTFQLIGGTQRLNYRRPNEMFVANA